MSHQTVTAIASDVFPDDQQDYFIDVYESYWAVGSNDDERRQRLKDRLIDEHYYVEENGIILTVYDKP